MQEVIVCDKSSPDMRQMPLSDLDHLIPNVVAKLFWIKYFGSEVEVPWERFHEAFTEHFDEHPEECMQKLKAVRMSCYVMDGMVYHATGRLVFTILVWFMLPQTLATHYTEGLTDVVQAQKYGCLTHKAGGLYEYFQVRRQELI